MWLHLEECSSHSSAALKNAPSAAAIWQRIQGWGQRAKHSESPGSKDSEGGCREPRLAGGHRGRSYTKKSFSSSKVIAPHMLKDGVEGGWNLHQNKLIVTVY